MKPVKHHWRPLYYRKRPNVHALSKKATLSKEATLYPGPTTLSLKQDVREEPDKVDDDLQDLLREKSEEDR